MAFIVCHNDADGIGCAYILLKAFPSKKFKIYFTPIGYLKRLLCSLILKHSNLDEIFICDISPEKVSVAISSAFQQATWIDHHTGNFEFSYPNVKVIVDENYQSATSLAAKHFGINDELVKIINQIDTNRVESEEAKYLRDLIGAIKWKFGNNFAVLNSKFKGIVKKLLHEGVDGLERVVSNAMIIEEFTKWLDSIKPEIESKTKFFEIKGKKVAVFESTTFVPTYFVFNVIKDMGNFDIIASLTHKPANNKIMTKIELRTQTNFNLINICKSLGGGGHRVACGATHDFISCENFVKTLEKFIE